MNAPAKQFGSFLRARRKESGWSLRQLGARAGIAHSTIQDVEKGDLDARLTWIVKLGKAFGEDWTPWQHN